MIHPSCAAGISERIACWQMTWNIDYSQAWPSVVNKALFVSMLWSGPQECKLWAPWVHWLDFPILCPGIGYWVPLLGRWGGLHSLLTQWTGSNTLRLRQNGRDYADNFFKCIAFEKVVCIISAILSLPYVMHVLWCKFISWLKFPRSLLWGSINNNSALVQVQVPSQTWTNGDPIQHATCITKTVC